MTVKLTNDAELAELLHRSRAKVETMTPAEREAMFKAQAESFARSMQPCEHGVVDWEECAECRRAALSEIKEGGEK